MKTMKIYKLNQKQGENNEPRAKTSDKRYL